jgi:hypothetical protein
MSSILFDGLINSRNWNEWESAWDQIVAESSTNIQTHEIFPTQHYPNINFSAETMQLDNTMVSRQAFRKITEDEKVYYECTWPNCKKRFTRRATNSNAHWIKHRTVSSHVCITCNLGFDRRSDLNRHHKSSLHKIA